jgi:alkylhydroperoxidase/carboxymuconolactone decarboxylase family protein YurZ
MKQENQEQIQKSKEILEQLKEKRGGNVLSFHKRIANDPNLLKSFDSQYAICKKELTHIPPKYIELLLIALGCSKGVQTTIDTHAKLAYEKGASIEEIGEVLRLVFFYCGASALIPGAEIFEELE